MAILTAPRCGVVPHSPNTALTGKPYRTITPFSGGVGDCCARCGAEERCEAFTLWPHTGSCELFEHGGLTNRSATATSGEPLSQWVRPPRLHGHRCALLTRDINLRGFRPDPAAINGRCARGPVERQREAGGDGAAGRRGDAALVLPEPAAEPVIGRQCIIRL